MENDNQDIRYTKGTYYFTMIIAIVSALTFLVILVCAVVIVPKAVSLIGTAQTTLDNMQTVSESLMDLKLSDTIQSKMSCYGNKNEPMVKVYRYT